MMKIKTECPRVISDKDKKVLDNLGNETSFCPSVILSDARKRTDIKH